MAIVVFISSILVFFSQELKSVYVKMLKNRALQLVVPLFICSYLLVKFQWNMMLLILNCRIGLFYAVYFFSKLNPFSNSTLQLERIFTLITLAFAPLVIASLIEKFYKPAAGKLFQIALRVSLFLWIFSLFLLEPVS